MARPGRPIRNRAARSFGQLRRFHHVIKTDKIFGTHTSPGRPERNRAARSFRQLRRFHHGINSNKVFGTHRGHFRAHPGQDRRFETEGSVGRWSPPPRGSDERRQDCDRRGRGRTSSADLPAIPRSRRRQRTGARPPGAGYPNKTRLLATGATRGGVLFGRGSLFYLLRNRFYVGEVKYKDEILPGEQPAIMDRALFDAVQQKLTDQWTTRFTTRNASDHLLTGFLFDDAGPRGQDATC